MIVVFTSNTQGGIMQLTLELVKVLNNIGKPSIALLPENSVSNSQGMPVAFYKKVKTFSKSDIDIRDTMKLINSLQPSNVFFTDSSIMSLQIHSLLGRELRKSIFVHDVAPHLSRLGVLSKLNDIVSRILLIKAFRKCDDIILLSQFSMELFYRKYQKFSSKAHLLRLGAHIPFEGDIISPELKNAENYFLFFGRIDKYKGIETLLLGYREYLNENNAPLKLVIAGAGDFSNREKQLLDSIEQVIVIRRFIHDEEIKALYLRARVVVLPYLEASQSGVLPIAYHYGKPVIISDLPGLKENVIDGKTGIIMKGNNSLPHIMRAFENEEHYRYMQKQIEDYYSKVFDWNQNVEQLMLEIEMRE